MESNNATANKIWQSQFSLKTLKQVQEAFEKLGAVEEPKFIELIQNILSANKKNNNNNTNKENTDDIIEDTTPRSFDDEDLRNLFLMIDADSNGTVTWKEFSNYLFLSEKLTNPNIQDENLREIFPNSIDAPYSHVRHADAILLIYRLTRRFTYYKDIFITAAHDGKLLAWDAGNLQLHNVVLTGLDWITSVVHMHHSHRLVVATTSGVKIYDIVNRELFTVRYYDEIPPWLLAHATPMALSYYFDEKKVIEYLIIADHDGIVTIYTFYDNGHFPIILDPRNVPPNIQFKDYTKIQRFKHHTDHITYMKYIPGIQLLVTASLDSTVKIFEVERVNRVRSTFRGHVKACNGFVYNERAKLMASCGVERDVLLWNPFSPDNISRLSGHNSSVKALCTIKDTNEIVSLDVEGITKVWDIRHAHCLQTLFPGEGINHVRTLIMDNTLPMKLITASRTLSQWPLSVGGIAEQTKENQIPLSHVLYNRNFRQIITVVQHSSVLNVWNAETGKFVRIVETESDSREAKKSMKDLNDITAITLDHGHRRVIIGTHKGNALTVWNTSNCKCLKILHKYSPLEEAELFKQQDEKKGKKKTAAVIKPVKKKNIAAPATSSMPPSSPLKKNTMKRKSSTVNIDINQTSKLKKYGARTLTEISAVENALIVEMLGGHKGVHLKRVTITAGWDKKIHVWYEEDENNTSYDLFYNKKIPNDGHHENHTGDIRSLTYCSPCFVATGCSDGQLIIWNFNTGAVHFTYKCADNSPITCVIWSERMKLLIVTCEDACIYFFNVRDTPSLYTKYEANHGIHYTPLQGYATIDSLSTYLLSGDNMGTIKVYHLGNPPAEDDFCTLEAHFVAHEESITGISVVESYEWAELYIVTTSRDGYACMFTLAGTPIGYFGQPIPWNILDPTTYNTEFSNEITYDGIHYADAIMQYGKENIPSIESKRVLTRVIALEKTIEETSDTIMPRVGDVWIYEDCNENVKVYKVGTILRVDVAADLVVYLNGFLQVDSTLEGTKDTVLLTDFFKTQQPNPRDKNIPIWRRHTSLSKYIGHIHLSETGEHYKAMYARLNGSDGEWYLVDTDLKPHYTDENAIILDTHGNIIVHKRPLKLHRAISLKMRPKGAASEYNLPEVGGTKCMVLSFVCTDLQ